MLSRPLVVLGLLTLGRAAAAQPPAASASPVAPAEIVSAARLRAAGDSLRAARTPSSRTAQLGRGPGLTYALSHRDGSGDLEVHAAWTDVFVVQAGTATLLSGGRVVGARESAPGELRGGTAEGATRATVRVGDVVTIPAGTPHQFLLAAGERITYLALKVAAPATR